MDCTKYAEFERGEAGNTARTAMVVRADGSSVVIHRAARGTTGQLSVTFLRTALGERPAAGTVVRS